MDNETGSNGRSLAVRLRALAHPFRWKLLDLVSGEGTATATRCAEVLGESVAACSYHLGILGKYGYLEPVPGVTGREKPWRVVGETQLLSAADGDMESVQASEAAMDAFLTHEFERLKSHLHARRFEEPPWADAIGLTGSTLYLTAQELARIRDDMRTVLARYEDRVRPPEEPDPAVREARVFFSTSVRPQR